MARFIRAIQPFASPHLLRNDIGMDHPDKPGDDDGGWGRVVALIDFGVLLPLREKVALRSRVG